MKMFRKSEGFTLVELMVVVLIIGILVAIAIPVFNSARANAQKRSCQANQRTIEGAYQTWYADDAANAATAATFVDGNLVDHALLAAGEQGKFEGDFIKAVPTCPGAGTYTLEFTTGGLSMNVICSVAAHEVY